MLFTLLLLCFFLSGFAALLYETAWAREFESVFGTSEIAVVCVLAAYMAGLAAGSAVAGRLVGRIRRPVLWYGLLEMGIAASALAVPHAIRAATWVQTAVLGGQASPPDGSSAFGALFYAVVAFCLLIVPTGLMGATLPLLARHAVRREDEIGPRVGALYAINTAGAVAGAATTGFLLLPALGLRATVYVGAGTNALVFAVAALIARASGSAARSTAATAVRSPAFHWVLPLTAASGFVSFTYEVLWTRLLGHLVGGTIQGFATMLASFLLGIAIGGAVAARLARDPERAARGFAVAQLGTAVLSLLAFMGTEGIARAAEALGAGGAGTLAANAVIAALGLLPASLCMGAIIPFAVRLVARDETEAAPAAARVYAWNTLGSICGALAGGFLLLPALRFEGTVALAAALNLVLALAAGILSGPRTRLVAGLAAAGLAGLLVVRPEAPWPVLRHSAMPAGVTSWRGDVVFYEVGRSSTVLLLDQVGSFRLTTNGLPESSVSRGRLMPMDPEPARWLGFLPTLLRPELRSMLVIGLGGGLTVESVPSSVENITVIELEAEVLRAHEWLAEYRERSPLGDPRVRIVVNDARGALQLTTARFGAVVSQPSHPWTAGASHLYTLEFFQLVQRHLEPGGIFLQWIGLPFVDDDLLRSLVATLAHVFPYVTLFRPAPGALLFAASDAPLDPLASAAHALEAAGEDFRRFGLRRPEDVAAAWQLGPADAAAFARGAALVTDDQNPLATRTARLGGTALSPERADQLFATFEPLSPSGDGLDPIYLARRLVSVGSPRRSLRLIQDLSDPAQRLTALGWVRSDLGQSGAAATFRTALAKEPASQSARFGLVRVMQPRLAAGEVEALEAAASLVGVPAAVVAGWGHASREEWSELRALDPVLASADALGAEQPDALRLRIRWRTASDDAGVREEAAELSLDLLSISRHPDDYLLAARAFAAASQPDEAVALIGFIGRPLPQRPGIQREILALLDTLRPEVETRAWQEVRRRFSAAPSKDLGAD